MFSKSGTRGFTRIELLVVVVTIALLALTQLAGWANYQQASQAAQCLQNLSQMHRAWQLYAEDHAGAILAAGSTLEADNVPRWIPSYQGDTADSLYSVTNSPLWNYTSKELETWHCPSDPSYKTYRGGGIEWVGKTLRKPRTYSMNVWMADRSDWTVQNNLKPQWRTFYKTTDITHPGRIFLFLDEHADSVNDGAYTMDMTGYPQSPQLTRMVDFPAANHGNGAGIIFADGHTEIKRWTDSRTTPAFKGFFLTWGVFQPNNPDIIWIQERSTVMR